MPHTKDQDPPKAGGVAGTDHLRATNDIRHPEEGDASIVDPAGAFLRPQRNHALEDETRIVARDKRARGGECQLRVDEIGTRAAVNSQ